MQAGSLCILVSPTTLTVALIGLLSPSLTLGYQVCVLLGARLFVWTGFPPLLSPLLTLVHLLLSLRTFLMLSPLKAPHVLTPNPQRPPRTLSGSPHGTYCALCLLLFLAMLHHTSSFPLSTLVGLHSTLRAVLFPLRLIYYV